MMIQALGQTYLKIAPKLSSKLDKGDIRLITKGTKIDVLAIKDSIANHTLLSLKEPLQGKYDWWVFCPHWEFNQINELVRFGDYNGAINWHIPHSKISDYFTVQEITQGDPRRIPESKEIEDNIRKLAAQLDDVRTKWGSPIGITSWYRPPQINAAVGGVPNSQHILGSAADIYPLNRDDLAFEQWLDEFWGSKALGYGMQSGRGFTHVDMRLGDLRWEY